ncbi:MAG TPA: hypothetical protein VFA18_17250 [Gemmataceae bacterium]|nr:hypothetical protein [Gemmataceae bacterium]
MKSLCAGLMFLALVGFTSGCNKSNSGSPGGPGMHNSGRANAGAKGDHGKPNNTFTLKPENVTVSQNDKAQLKIGIERNQFGGAVSLEFSPTLQDVKLTGPKEIPMNQDDVTFEVTAGPNAQVGDHQMTVTGEATGGAPGGPPSTAHFNITVKAGKGANKPPANAAFDVNAKDITIAAGDSAEYQVSVHRAEGSNEAVKVSFQSLPEGVTVTPKTFTVQPGVAEATFKISVAANAAPGSSERVIQATPMQGTTVTHRITFKINPRK